MCAFIHDGMVFQFFLQHRHHERHIYGHQRCQIISDEQYVVDETDQSSNFPLFNFQSSISYWFSQLKPRITSQAMHCTSYNIFTHTHTYFYKLEGDLNLPIWMKFIVQQIFNVEMAMVTSSDWVLSSVFQFTAANPRVCTTVVPSSW